MASAKFGNLFDTIVNAATAVLPFVTNRQSGRSVPITQAITELVTRLNQLEVGFAALPSSERLRNADVALQTASQIQAAFEQLQGSGTDATYLQNAKTTTIAVIAHIRQMIQEAQSSDQNTPVAPTPQPTATNNTPVTLPDGQIIYVPSQQGREVTNNQLIQGVDNMYLLGGMGLLAYLLLKK